MSDIKIENNIGSLNFGDVVIENGDLVLVEGLQEITQNVLQNLRTFFNEWFLDTTIGVPYFQQILVKNPDQGKVDALLIQAILSTPGIIQLLQYSSTIDTGARKLTVSFKALSTSGIVDYRGLVT